MNRKPRKYIKTCEKCKSTVTFTVVIDEELATLKKTVADCQKAMAQMIEAGRAEKVRRDIREGDLITENNTLRKEIRNLTGGY